MLATNCCLQDSLFTDSRIGLFLILTSSWISSLFLLLGGLRGLKGLEAFSAPEKEVVVLVVELLDRRVVRVALEGRLFPGPVACVPEVLVRGDLIVVGGQDLDEGTGKVPYRMLWRPGTWDVA